MRKKKSRNFSRPAHRIHRATASPPAPLTSPGRNRTDRPLKRIGASEGRAIPWWRSEDPVPSTARDVVGVGGRRWGGAAGGDPRRLRLHLPPHQAQGEARAASATGTLPRPRFCHPSPGLRSWGYDIWATWNLETMSWRIEFHFPPFSRLGLLGTVFYANCAIVCAGLLQDTGSRLQCVGGDDQVQLYPPCTG